MAEDRWWESATLAEPAAPEAADAWWEEAEIERTQSVGGSAARAGARGFGAVISGVPVGGEVIARNLQDGNAEARRGFYEATDEDLNRRLGVIQERIDETSRRWMNGEIDEATADQRIRGEMERMNALRTRYGLPQDRAADLAAMDEPRQPIRESQAYQAGEAVKNFVSETFGDPDPADEGKFWLKLAEGAGSMTGFMATAIVAGPASTAYVGATTAAAGQLEDALQSGATEEEALRAAGLSAIVGTSEIVPIMRFLKPLGAKGVGAFVQRVLRNAAEEGLQEGFQGTMQNLIAQGIYDPERGAFKDVPEQMLIGAILGGGVGGVGALVAPDRPQPAAAQPRGAEEPPAASPQLALPPPALITPPPEGSINLAPEERQPPRATPPASPNTPASGPYVAPPESAILLAIGEAPEDIMEMSPAERAAAVQEAQDAGVTPLSPEETDAAMRPVVAAYDAERPDSPRITDEDRASPIPTGMIDDGKAEIDRLIGTMDPRTEAEAAPAAPQAGAAQPLSYEEIAAQVRPVSAPPELEAEANSIHSALSQKNDNSILNGTAPLTESEARLKNGIMLVLGNGYTGDESSKQRLRDLIASGRGDLVDLAIDMQRRDVEIQDALTENQIATGSFDYIADPAERARRIARVREIRAERRAQLEEMMQIAGRKPAGKKPASATETPTTAPAAPAAAGVAPQGGMAAPLTTPAPPTEKQKLAAQFTPGERVVFGKGRSGEQSGTIVRVDEEGNVFLNLEPIAGGLKGEVRTHPEEVSKAQPDEPAAQEPSVMPEFWEGTPKKDRLGGRSNIRVDGGYAQVNYGDFGTSVWFIPDGAQQEPVVIAAPQRGRSESEIKAFIAAAGSAPGAKTDKTDRTPSEAPPSAPTIEPYSEKSFIVRGVSKEDGDAAFAGLKAKGLWNAREGGWVFSKKREAEVREALSIGNSEENQAPDSEPEAQAPDQPAETPAEPEEASEPDTPDVAGLEAAIAGVGAAPQPPKAPEEPAGDPEMPPGFSLTSTKKMTKAEKDARPEADGADFMAIIARQRPYSVISGYGATRAAAIRRAVAAAERQIEREGQRKPEGDKGTDGDKTPSVPPSPAPAAAPAPQPAPSRPATYGSSNTLVSSDRAEEIRKKLRDKLGGGTLNAGIDPEVLALGAELAAYHIEAGARKFAQAIRAVAADLGMEVSGLRRYGRAWYNGARDMMEDAGLSIEGMDDADIVRAQMDVLFGEVVEKPAAAPDIPKTEAPDDTRRPEGRDPEPLEEPVSPEREETQPRPTGGRGGGAGRPGDGGDSGNAGDGPGGGVVRGPKRLPDDPADSGVVETDPEGIKGENPGNFVIAENFPLGEGTTGQKLDNNIAAIRLVKALIAENRYATPEEQAVLARYVGWGGLPQAFDKKNAEKTDQWGRAYRALKELLTDQEWRLARNSTRNAHYTSRGIVRSMWAAMRWFGFEGGRALEPTVGTGNFLGLQPEDMGAATEWHASEIDSITGSIAKFLYPDANVFAATGFQDAPFVNGAFDIAIGNPPFGSETIEKGRVPEIAGMKIHNYIIAKAGMHLRPGGIMGMVVTHRFLDTANPEARAALAREFRFIGAFRLPNNAFKENAGTDVVTDVIFLQKLKEGEAPALNAAWLDVNGSVSSGGEAIRVNRYYEENPTHIIGRSAMDGTMYGRAKTEGEYTVHADGRDVEQEIGRIIGEVWASERGALGQRTEALEAAVAVEAMSTLPIGGMMLTPDGKVIRRETTGEREITPETLWSDMAEEWDQAFKAAEALKLEQINPSADQSSALIDAARAITHNAKGEPKAKMTAAEKALFDLAERVRKDGPRFRWRHDKALEEIGKSRNRKLLGNQKYIRIKGMLGLRSATLRLIRAEQTDAPNIDALRADLRAAYDAFVEKFGFVSDQKNVSVLQGDIGVELGLEVDYRPAEDDTPASAKRASILSKRVIFPYSEVEKAETVDDAAAISLIERGRIDLAHVAKLTGRDVSDVRADMAERDDPLIFFDPEGEEWVDAEAYLSGNVRAKLNAAKSARLSRNVSALTAVLPEPKDQSRITPAIRGQWIPAEIFEEFLRAVGIADAQVRIYQDAGTVSVDGNVVQLSEYGQQFQHDRKDVLEMFSAAMKGKAVVIYDRGPNDTRVKNEQATREVNAIIGRMASEFQSWAFENPDRVKRIVDAYNEKMNTHVERKYNGVKYLRLVGANPNVKPRNSQKNGAWRMITSRSALMHHIVGAGKTYTAIMAVMERRRMGLSKKPMIVVPNHLVTQWASDIYNLYPGAKVLAATPADFTKSNRRRLLARIATGDFDVVVIGHSSLGFIPPAEADAEAIITEQMEALEEAIEAAREAEGKKSLSVKNLTKRLEKYEAKLDDLRDRPRDDLGFDFTTMGVDYIAVDEAQEFKNLEYATAGDRLVGMNDPNGSQRAFDLYVKTRGLLSRKGGVAFLTGTPISNSLVEIYTVLKYLAYDDLKARGEANFDAWSGAYVQAEHRFEYTAAQSLVERRVMSGLVNLESLSALYRNVADIILDDQIREIYADQIREENRANGTNLSERFPTPKVKNGGRVLMNADPTPDQVEFTDYLVARMAAIKSGGRDYISIDNALWVLTDARKASIDIRTMDASAQRDPNSKVMRTAREIMRIYEANTERQGTQLVFADSSTPKKNATAEAKRSVRAALAKTMGDAAARKQANEWDESGRLLTSQWTEALRRINDQIDDPDTSADRRDALNEYLASLQDVEAAVLTADSGFSFYDDLRAVLIEQGVPASEIEFIHDYDTPQQKKSLFNKVNDGRVRILMGSTAKMGAGTNVQKRLVGLHHVDAPWRPSDVEQREGRIIRQGNMFYEQDPDGFEVEILAYSTRGTSDVVLWQVLERKARSIERFLNGSLDKMEEEGGDADSYAEFMAQSTGNPVFRLNMEADKALLGEEAATLGRLRARAEGIAFLQTADDEIRKAGAALESLRASRVGEFVVDDVRGDPADFGPVMEEANAAYQKAYDEWMVARNDAEETILRMKEEGADKKAFPKIPAAPAKPNPISKEITEKSTYAAAMRAFIQKIADAEIGDDFSAQIGDIRARVQIVDSIGKRATVDLLAGPAGAWVDRKTFGAVDPFTGGLPEYLDPDNIESARIRTEGWRKENLADLKNRKAFAEKSSKIEVDTAPLEEAKAVANFYKKAVRIAEARAEAERAARPNRFIEMDVDRPLSGTGSSAIDERPTLVDLKTGERFEGTGIGASLGNITKDGDSYEAAMFETRRVSDGKLAIITALKKDGAWASEYVDVIPPKAEAAIESAIVREQRAPSGWESVDPWINDAEAITDEDMAALRKRLDDLGLERVGLAIERQFKAIKGRGIGMTATAAGSYRQRGQEALITIRQAVNPERTLDHEAIHALYNLGLFTPAEWATLSRRATQSWIRKHKVKERYPEGDEALWIEEAIAEEFATQRAKADPREALSVRKVLARIGEFMEAVGNWARGLGFQSAANVFGRAGRGEVGRREAGAGREASRERVDTSTAAFRKWFGDSKVVDKNGAPLVVYHGTGADIEAFDPAMVGANFLVDKEGFFFTTNVSHSKVSRGDGKQDVYEDMYSAGGYAKNAVGGAPNVIPAYLSIQNPFTLEKWADSLGYEGREGVEALLDGRHPQDELDMNKAQIVETAKADGHDGIIFADGRDNVFVAFRPEQIKSVFNRGTWDANSPLIRERRVTTPGAFETYDHISARAVTDAFLSGEFMQRETWRDFGHVMRRTFSDSMDALKRQQAAIERAAGQAIPLMQDAYMAASLYFGRTGDQLRRFYEEDVRGITKNLREAGISTQEMDDYLIARHVEERNRQMAKLREIEEPDHQFVKALTDNTIVGGSGFSQQWANGVLRRVARDPRATMFREVARKLDRINAARLDQDVASGMLSQEAADAMRNVYKHYVPLRGFEGEEPDAMGSGRGFDTRGKEQRATGRRSRAESPLSTALAMRANGIIRAEKNRVGRAMLRLVQANPNPAAWTVDRAETKTRIKKKAVVQIDPVTGAPVVVNRDVARDQKVAASRLDPNVMIVKVGGDEVLIRFENRDLARAMKNMGAENGAVWVRVLGAATRMMSALNTTLNIEWVVTNMFRDLQTAGIQISDEKRKGLAKAMFKNWPAAMKGAAMHLSGKGSGKWKDIADEFAREGGKVDYIEFRDVQGFKRLIEGDITESKLKRMFTGGPKALFDGIQVFTGTVENAIRIAAYQAAVEQGVPKAKAASIARELTVNFNRKGEIGPAMNALYMFFNAAVQGNARLIRSAMKSGFTRKALIGLVGIGALEAMLGAGDDDEYEKVENYVRERNLVIMLAPLGLGPAGSYWKIPLPYGFNVAKVMGTEIGRSILYGNPEGAAANVVSAAMNSFNPIGGQDFIAMATPTLIDPMLDIARNRNFFGSSIRPDYPNDTRPDSEKYFPNVSGTSKALTAWLNDATGGNQFREGAISISPENVDHIASAYLGGFGRLILNLERTAADFIADRPIDAEKAPFVRQIFGQTYGEMPTWRAYDRVSDAVNALEAEIKGFTKAGDAAAVREARQRDPVLTAMLGPMRVYDKRIAALRKQEREIKASNLPDDEKARRIEAIRQKSYETQRAALAVWDRKRNDAS